MRTSLTSKSYDNEYKIFNQYIIMGRKPKVKIEKFDEKKMETAYDFGNITVPTKWEEVTLQMLSDYLALSKEKEDALEKDKKQAERDKTDMPNEKDEKYNLTDKDLLRIFTNFDMEKYDLLPVELYNSIMSNFGFVLEPMPEWKPTNHLSYNGMEFVINDKESLKVLEWDDCESILRNNIYDYPSLLAVLCRKVTGTKTDNVTGLSWEVNEVYDYEFANKIFDARRKMFAEMPITKAMGLIGFFLTKGLISTSLSQNSITMIGHQLLTLVENLEDSAKHMAFRNPSMLLRMIKLRKLKKSINRICFNS